MKINNKTMCSNELREIITKRNRHIKALKAIIAEMKKETTKISREEE